MPDFGPVRRAVSADGVTLAFTVAGQGTPLVLVPWVPFSNIEAEQRDPLLGEVWAQMGRRVTVVRYDGRGTGRSQRDVTDLSLDAMVADLEAVIDAAGISRVSLLGQYNSCPHAIAFAARYPARVRRMVLFAGSARGWDAMSARQTRVLLSLIEQDWDLFAETAAHQWLGWSAGEAGRALAEAIRAAVTPEVARATMQAASAADVSDEIGNVAAPTLVLHRRDMTQIPLEVSRSLAAALPRGRLVVLEGSQPSLFLEDPSAVVNMLLDFVRDGVEASRVVGVAAPTDRAGNAAGIPLTQREGEVLRVLAGGESNAQIARRLGISTHTVERHVANIYAKIGARGRADATAYAIRHGLA